MSIPGIGGGGPSEPKSIEPRLNTYLDPAMKLYLLEGIDPGGFLKAILSDNLRQAVARADYVNSTEIANIMTWVELFAPPESFGSLDKVNAWMDDSELRVDYRCEYAEGILVNKSPFSTDSVNNSASYA